MALINLGNIADDGTGDDLRTAFSKINGAFTTLGITSPSGTGTGPGTGTGTGTSNVVSTDSNGDIYVNKVFFKNSFPSVAGLPSAATYPGMFVYVAGDGAYVSNGTSWKKIPTWNNAGAITDGVLRWNGSDFTATDTGVKTFNNQTGDVKLTSGDISNALGGDPLTDAGGRISIDYYGNITFGTGASLGVTGFIKMPSGTIAQRPVVPVLGMFRYNNETDSFEGYVGPSSGPSWRTVGPLGSAPATFTTLGVTGTATINNLVATSMNGPLGTVTPAAATVTTLTVQGASSFSNGVTLTSNSPANALGTGALVISGTGGASIGGNLFVGGAFSTSALIATSTTQSTAPTNGALIVAGGAGIAKNLNVGGSLGVTGTSTLAGIIFSTNTTESTTPTTGALVVAGGVGIVKNLNVGGNFGLVGTATLTNTTDSTTPTTGAVIITGGVGIAKNLNVGGNFKLTGTLSTTNTTDSTTPTTGAVIVTGGVGIAKNLNVGGNFGLAGALSITNATESTSPTTGALIVTGGVGIGKNLNVGGKIYTADTNNSITPGTTGSRDLKKYIDDYDYLNFDPKAGVLNENYVPVYADFKFGLGTSGGSVFRLKDKQGFDVIFFHGNTPYGYLRPFRAYRFSSSSPWIFDAEPTTVNFLNANERLQVIFNIGTQFAYLQLVDSTTGAATRTVLVKTQGSSKGTEWSLYVDVTSLSSSGSPNFFLYVDKTSAANDRILRLTLADPMVLEVYNPTKTLLRSQTLVTGSSDFSGTDWSGAGRTNTYNNYTSIPWGYQPFGVCFPFTWNKFTENLLMVGVGYRYWLNSASVLGEGGFGATVSWSIPKTWLLSGTGTNVNLIQVNSVGRGGKRYNLFEDDTWNSSTGGMGNTYFNAGWALGILTDEYAKTLNIGSSIHWGNTSDLLNIIWDGTVARTTAISSVWPAPIESPTVKIIDAAPWSKNLYAHWGFIIGNNLTMETNSVKYGSKVVAVDFLTNRFSTSLTTNDTLILDNVDWVEEYSRSVYTVLGISVNQRRFGTTVKSGGTPIYYLATPGQKLYTVTLTGSPQRRVYTDSGLTVPAMPSTIGSVTAVANQEGCVWNGDTASPVYWCTVSGTNPTIPAGLTSYSGTTTVATNMMYIAKCSGGTWSNIYGPFALNTISQGNNVRHDATNGWGPMSGSNLLTESGKYQPAGYVIHNVDYFWMTFDTTAPSNPSSFTTSTGARFGITNGGFGTSAGWEVSYGYSTVLGYYQFAGYWSYTGASIVSTKDVTGASSTVYTEAQWYAGSRYLMNVSAESATGLSVATKPFPLFIGGYYTTTPDSVLAVTANATNYLYVEKTAANRDSTNVFVSTELLPIGFSQQLIGTFITNSDKVTSATYTPINSFSSLPVASVSQLGVARVDGVTTKASNGVISATGASLTQSLGSVSGAVNIDLSAYTAFKMTVTGAFSLNIQNPVAGQSFVIVIKQDATGSRAVTWPGTMLFSEGFKTISTAANTIDFLTVYYDGSNYYASLTVGYA